MEKTYTGEIRRINFLFSEMESLYHLADLRLGISDSASLVLYALYDAGGQCPLADIYKNSGISKQTVNAALRKLEADGVIYLEPEAGRGKRVRLTRSGEDYVSRTAARLYEAECEALSTWSAGEIDAHISLLEKYAASLGEQLKRL